MTKPTQPTASPKYGVPRRQFLQYMAMISAIPWLHQGADVAKADVARHNLMQLQRFNRYPQRNAALGRSSSRDEILFLQQLHR